jgi:alkanesulfonate monooxygenase SsuD/methylene tetrahydromethanopterin reductase-like flavin-dependent oxidoreductase (luciferase family)
MIGGNGPRMLKIAAQYADTWNTFGGMDVKSFEEMLAVTQEQNYKLDGYCAEIGRDPNTLRRSVLIFTHEEYQKLYSVPVAFEEIVKRYQDIGISEIVFF